MLIVFHALWPAFCRADLFVAITDKCCAHYSAIFSRTHITILQIECNSIQFGSCKISFWLYQFKSTNLKRYKFFFLVSYSSCANCTFCITFHFANMNLQNHFGPCGGGIHPQFPLLLGKSSVPSSLQSTALMVAMGSTCCSHETKKKNIVSMRLSYFR